MYARSRIEQSQLISPADFADLEGNITFRNGVFRPYYITTGRSYASLLQAFCLDFTGTSRVTSVARPLKRLVILQHYVVDRRWLCQFSYLQYQIANLPCQFLFCR